MKDKKLWRVYLYGTLPCSAFIDVMASSEDDAKEQAEEKWDRANWRGADYDKPQDGAAIEVGVAERI